jgi:hypothetical protein
MMARNQVGHLQIVRALDGRRTDILLDTGAARTVVHLGYCRSEGISVRDTGRVGGGAGDITLPNHAPGDARLTLEGLPVRSDGIFAIDLTHIKQGLTINGADRVHAALGAAVLRYHQAVIDYATPALFLKEASAEQVDPPDPPATGR